VWERVCVCVCLWGGLGVGMGVCGCGCTLILQISPYVCVWKRERVWVFGVCVCEFGCSCGRVWVRLFCRCRLYMCSILSKEPYILRKENIADFSKVLDLEKSVYTHVAYMCVWERECVLVRVWMWVCVWVWVSMGVGVLLFCRCRPMYVSAGVCVWVWVWM